jgi:hypothetical protein
VGGAEAVETPVPDDTPAHVPPPLGPQAILPADANPPVPLTQNAGTRHSFSLGPRGRLLGVGLALIGAGSALFGWRIRKL